MSAWKYTRLTGLGVSKWTRNGDWVTRSDGRPDFCHIGVAGDHIAVIEASPASARKFVDRYKENTRKAKP